MKIIHQEGKLLTDDYIKRFADISYLPKADKNVIFLINYYRNLKSYQFHLVIVEDDGTDIARVMVGTNTYWPFAFFGMFECIDNFDVFEMMMDRAEQLIVSQTHSTLLGPINFNGIHGWMFRFMGNCNDLPNEDLHPSYYTHFFEKSGWSIKERSVSGHVHDHEQRRLTTGVNRINNTMIKNGHKPILLSSLSLDDWVEILYPFILRNFDIHFHKYIPLDFTFFKTLCINFFSQFDDKYCLLGSLHDDRLSSFILSYPVGNANKYTVKTVAVDKRYRWGVPYAWCFKTIACHTEDKYGHVLTWRRTNTKNEGTKRLRKNSKITHQHVCFSKNIDRR
ncbi:MAG: hypothetical protein AB2806_13680 [Candidatus Thiodiazotropha sp.]